MYTSIQRPVLLALLLILAALPVFSQTVNPALTEAKKRLACGAGVPIAATYLPGGALQVTCQAPGSAPHAQSSAEGLPQTGLAAAPGAAAIAGVLFLAVIASDSSSTTTTAAAPLGE